MKNRTFIYLTIIIVIIVGLTCKKKGTDLEWGKAADIPKDIEADFLIKNGMLYDGTTTDATIQDIAFKNDTIVFVGKSEDAKLTVKKTIDAKSFIITPGFIDPHTHCESDLNSSNAELRANISYLRQGVTTVLTGNDGYGTINTQQQLSKWQNAGIGTNVGLFVGFGEVRKEILASENIQPNAIQLATMKELVAKSMREGAFGLSTALSYVPQSYSQRNGTEVKELAKASQPYGGVYDTHLRSQSGAIIDAIKEVEEISEYAGNLKVHISHIKVTPISRFHLVSDIITKIKEARAKGIDMTANVYPYLASADGLSSILSSSYRTSQTVYNAKYNNATDKNNMLNSVNSYFNSIGGSIEEGAKRVIVADSNPLWKGKSIYEISQNQAKTPANTVLDMLYTKLAISVHTHSQSEEVMKEFLKQPYIVTGSDGVKSHPRSTGTFPEVIKKYSVDQNLQSLVQAIHTSSGLTAQIFGIKKRGILKVGNYADILVIDLNKYKANSSYDQPDLYATGIKHIFLNGKHVVENDIYKGNHAGKALKKNQ